VIWGYEQRWSLEFTLVAAILMILVSLAVETLHLHIKNARLTEPVGIAKDIQLRMTIDHAFSGKWPEKKLLKSDELDLPDSIESFDIDANENMKIILNTSSAGVAVKQKYRSHSELRNPI